MTSLCSARPVVSLGTPTCFLLKGERITLKAAAHSRFCGAGVSRRCRWSSSRAWNGKGASCRILCIQRPWKYKGFQSFSTNGGSLKDKNAPVVKTNEVLAMASQEARHLSALAPRSSSNCPHEHVSSEYATVTVAPSPKDATDASNAAKALLTITYPTEPLLEAINRKDLNTVEQVSSLHRALVAVTSWCLSLVSVDPSLLRYSLDVARRAGELSLPLHLPLYGKIANAVAQQSSYTPCSKIILEVARCAGSALRLPIHARFFSEPLISLVQRQEKQEAIVLLKGMKAFHDIDFLDYETAMEMLEILNDTTDVEDADAMELFLILNKSMMREMSREPIQSASDKSLSLDETVAALFDDEPSMEDVMELIEHLSDEQDEDGKLADLMESVIANSKDLKAVYNELIEMFRGRLPNSTTFSPGENSRGVIKVNPKSGTWEQLPSSRADSDELSSSDEEVHDLARDRIYSRDFSNWKLPDVTEQMMQLNEGRDVLYSPEYEETIIKNMAEEELDGFEPGDDW